MIEAVMAELGEPHQPRCPVKVSSYWVRD